MSAWLPSLNIPVAVNCVVVPAAALGALGVMSMDCRVGVEPPPPPHETTTIASAASSAARTWRNPPPTHERPAPA